MEQPPSSPSFVGIDVANDRLDAHVRPAAETFAVARDGKGLEALVAVLRGRDVALVVLEATGGFELTVAAALAGGGLPLAVVNPCQIRDFARATGRLAKTDALDAEAITRFAEAIRWNPVIRNHYAVAPTVAESESFVARRAAGNHGLDRPAIAVHDPGRWPRRNRAVWGRLPWRRPAAGSASRTRGSSRSTRAGCSVASSGISR